MTTDNETKVENQTDANAKADEGSEDSEWGFSSEGSGISRETKIGLALIFILLSAFGFVVFRKMNPPNNQPSGEAAPAIAGEDGAKPDADADSNSSDGLEPPVGGAAPQSGFVAGDNSSGGPDEFGFGDNSRPLDTNAQTAEDFGSPQSLDGGGDFTAPGQQSEPDARGAFAAGDTAGNTGANGGAFDPDDPFTRNANRETNAGAVRSAAATPPAEPDFGFGGEDLPPTGFQSDSRNVAGSRNGGTQFGSEASLSGTQTAAGGAANANSGAAPTDAFGNPIPGAGANVGNDAATTTNQDRVYIGNTKANNGFDGPPTSASFDGSDAVAANDNRLGGFAPIETTRREASSRTAVQGAHSEPPRFGTGFTADKPAVIAANDTGGFEKPFTGESQTGPKPMPTLDLGGDVPVRKPVPTTAFGRGDVGGVDSNRFDSNSFEPPVRTAEHAFGTASPVGTFSSQSQFAASSAADEYVIQPNENFWSISKKKYGTVRYFQALRELNKSRVPDPKRMPLGTKILVPSPQELEARFPALLPKSTRSDRFASAAGRRTAGNNREQPFGFFLSPTGQPMFRVGDDDTLTRISKAHLGRSSRWIQVYNMNRDRVQNPDKLNIGLVLRLPADASQVRLSPTTGAFR